MSPEEVVEGFYSCIVAGDFQGACALCDSIAMKSYIDMHRAFREEKGNDIMMIASEMLGQNIILTDEIRKDNERRIVDYRIRDNEGRMKRKTAVLGKDKEGRWKIEGTADRE